MYYTHLVFGLLTSLVSFLFFDINNKLLFIFIVVFFSIFPDLDEKRSKIGRKHKITSTIINFIFGHRGFFHTIYIPLLIFFILNIINFEIALAALIGYCSHLFLDALTRKGIKPFYPLINNRINGFFRTGSLVEKILFSIVLFSSIYLLIIYI